MHAQKRLSRKHYRGHSLARVDSLRTRVCSVLLRALLLCAPAVCVSAPPAQPLTWDGSFLGRVEALAVLQTLNADLLSHDSATLTLQRWCEVHHLASPPTIVASRVPGVA